MTDRDRPPRLHLWTPVLVYMAAIFLVSGLSSPPMPDEVPDVSLHGLAYFGLALVTLRAVAGGRWAGVTVRALVISWAIATVYGATDEWHQSFVPGRTAEWRDLVADALGAAAGAAAAGAWSIIRRL